MAKVGNQVEAKKVIEKYTLTCTLSELEDSCMAFRCIYTSLQPLKPLLYLQRDCAPPHLSEKSNRSHTSLCLK